MGAKIPQHVREEQLRALPGKRFLRWAEHYVGQNSKALMKCEACDHEWRAGVEKLVGQGTGCPKCAKMYRPTTEEFVARAVSIHGDKYDYSKAVYVSARTPVVIVCRTHGEFVKDPDHHVGKQRGGCPKCSGKERVPAEKRVEQLKHIPGLTFVKLDGKHTNAYSRATMRCDSCGHEWSSVINNLVNNGRRCPSCTPRGFQDGDKAVIYALVSEGGGLVKVGISNNFKKRLGQLRSNTPFAFSVAETVRLENGIVARQLESIIRDEFESAGLSGFDGATEWLKFNSLILATMRTIA